MRRALAVLFFVALSAFADEASTARRFEEIKNDPLLLRRFLEEMPKGGDLHNHLAGAIWAESYLKWAAEDGLCVDTTKLAIAAPPCDEAKGLVTAQSALYTPLHDDMIDAMSMRDFVPSEDDRSGHDHFFRTFSRFKLPQSTHTPDMLAELVRRFAEENVDYIEVLASFDLGAARKLGATLTAGAPFGQLREEIAKSGKVGEIVATSKKLIDDAETKMREVLRCGTPQAQKGCDMTLRYLFEIHRGYPREQVFAEIVIGHELAAADARVVGMNPVMPEDGFTSMQQFDEQTRMYAYLRPLYGKGHLSAHAGELTGGLVPPEGLRNHIRDTVLVAGARRIGHGVGIARETDMAGLLRTMAERRVAVEICLTSNDVILGVKGKHHPLRLYLRSGVPIVLATDDAGVSRIDLTNEFQRAVEEHGLTYADLKRAARNSLEYSFLEGESLWADGKYGVYNEMCRRRTPPCDSLIQDHAKAREQWRLEERFRAFESATAPTGTAAPAP